jgi:hypothetical protein
MWIHALSDTDLPANVRHGMPLFLLLNGLLAGISGLQVWCGLLLTLSVAMMHIYVNRLNLTNKISYLPALCYLLLTGGVPAIHVLNPAIPATFFLNIALIRLMISFRNEQLSYAYFTAPVYIAIATFFHCYAYVFMPVVWLCLFFFRPGYWREWVFSLLGFLFPFFWYLGWCLLRYDSPAKLFDLFAQMFSFPQVMPQWNFFTCFFLFFAALLTLFSLIYLLRSVGIRKIIVRNSYYTILFIAALVLLMTVIVPEVLPFAWYLISFPFSLFIAYYLANVRSVRWGNIVLGLLMIAVGLSQVMYYVKNGFF